MASGRWTKKRGLESPPCSRSLLCGCGVELKATIIDGIVSVIVFPSGWCFKGAKAENDYRGGYRLQLLLPAGQ